MSEGKHDGSFSVIRKPRLCLPPRVDPDLLALDGYREEVRFAFPVDVSSNSGPSLEPLPSGPIVITFDTSEEGKIPKATATFRGKEYPAVMNSYRFTIDGEVFASSRQYRDAAMIGAATIVVPSGERIEFPRRPGPCARWLGER